MMNDIWDEFKNDYQALKKQVQLLVDTMNEETCPGKLLYTYNDLLEFASKPTIKKWVTHGVTVSNGSKVKLQETRIEGRVYFQPEQWKLFLSKISKS